MVVLINGIQRRLQDDLQRNDSAPPARLKDREQLGWSTWLGNSEGAGLGVVARKNARTAGAKFPDYAVGMVFEPEQYSRSRYRSEGSDVGMRTAAVH